MRTLRIFQSISNSFIFTSQGLFNEVLFILLKQYLVVTFRMHKSSVGWFTFYHKNTKN
jgi:hypothetical protein